MLDRNAIYCIKSDSFVARKLDDELILVPLVGSVADMTGILSLNNVSASIFDAIDGKNSINDIILQLLDEYDVDCEVLENDIEHFFKQAQEKNIIEKIDN